MLKNIVLAKDNTNCAYELLMSNCKKAFNQCFPLTQQHCKTKNNQTWFDKDLYLIMVNKSKFFKKYLKKKNVLNKANFNKIRNSYNRALQEKKQSFVAQTFIKMKNDMRQTGKNINRHLGKVKISYASLSINNITIDDPKQITNHFNDYFVNIASKLVSNLPQLPHNFQTYLPSPTLNSLYF